jgi:hypothetical protein
VSRSGTIRNLLVDDLIQIAPECSGIERRCVTEHGNGSIGRDKSVAPERTQFSHWSAVSSHHERRTLIQRAHDPTAVIAEFTLGDLLGHGGNRSTTCYIGICPSSAGGTSPATLRQLVVGVLGLDSLSTLGRQGGQGALDVAPDAAQGDAENALATTQ